MKPRGAGQPEFGGSGKTLQSLQPGRTGPLTRASRTAIAAAAGMTCCLTLGLQSALSSENHDPGLVTRAGHLTLKANFSAETPNYLNMRFAQVQDLAFTVSDIAAEPNKPIALRIQLVDSSIDDYRFFKIKGLPESFKLSSGFPTKSAWLVGVKNVDGLTIMPPEEFVGDVVLQILLFKGKDDPPQKRTVTVSIRPKEQGADQSVTSSVETISPPLDPQAQTEKSSLETVLKRPISKEEEHAAMDRASELLENADIAAARLIYESMAHKGSSRAAFAMGQTFDPAFLGNFVIGGLIPDIEQATKWYKLAAELGSSEAQARLVALNAER